MSGLEYYYQSYDCNSCWAGYNAVLKTRLTCSVGNMYGSGYCSVHLTDEYNPVVNSAYSHPNDCSSLGYWPPGWYTPCSIAAGYKKVRYTPLASDTSGRLPDQDAYTCLPDLPLAWIACSYSVWNCYSDHLQCWNRMSGHLQQKDVHLHFHCSHYFCSGLAQLCVSLTQ